MMREDIALSYEKCRRISSSTLDVWSVAITKSSQGSPNQFATLTRNTSEVLRTGVLTARPPTPSRRCRFGQALQSGCRCTDSRPGHWRSCYIAANGRPVSPAPGRSALRMDVTVPPGRQMPRASNAPGAEIPSRQKTRSCPGPAGCNTILTGFCGRDDPLERYPVSRVPSRMILTNGIPCPVSRPSISRSNPYGFPPSLNPAQDPARRNPERQLRRAPVLSLNGKRPLPSLSVRRCDFLAR